MVSASGGQTHCRRRRRPLRVVLCPRVLVEYSKCQVITTVVHISGTRAVAYQLRGHFRGIVSWVHGKKDDLIGYIQQVLLAAWVC